MVHMMRGIPNGLSWNSDEIWSQNSDGVNGASETGDHFGWSIASEIIQYRLVYLPLVRK